MFDMKYAHFLIIKTIFILFNSHDFRLIVHKNSKGEPHCPVLFKVFNNNSHIVAIKNTGNVFSYEVKLRRDILIQ